MLSSFANHTYFEATAFILIGKILKITKICRGLHRAVFQNGTLKESLPYCHHKNSSESPCTSIIKLNSGGVHLLPTLSPSLCAVFEEPEDPSARSFFSEIISSVSDVKFSHSGRYLLTRDYLTAKVWDLNMESKPLETYQVCVTTDMSLYVCSTPSNLHR